jgi:modulator of FtsH protease
MGASSSQVGVTTASGAVITIPPLVAFFAQHWIIGGALFLGSVLGASWGRHRPGINLLALFFMALMSGLISAPAIFIAQLSATNGTALTLNPVRDAFLLAVVAFGGLTTYVFTSKRDFSFLKGFVTVGLFVIIGASLLGLFIHSAAFQLAIASAGVLLFAGVILYATSRILRDPLQRQAPSGAPLRLFLDFLNLFLFLLQIFAGGRRD